MTLGLFELPEFPFVRLKPNYGEVPKVSLISSVNPSGSSDINERERVIEDELNRVHVLTRN